jgi:hypothetical protein
VIESDNNIGQGRMNFQKIWEPHQKSRCQNGDDKRGPTVKRIVAPDIDQHSARIAFF